MRMGQNSMQFARKKAVQGSYRGTEPAGTDRPGMPCADLCARGEEAGSGGVHARLEAGWQDGEGRRT